MKKGIYKPSSDFNFEFVAEVLCTNPNSSGYMVKVTPERNHESTRYKSAVVLVCITEFRMHFAAKTCDTNFECCRVLFYTL